VSLVVVAEVLSSGVDMTYSAADATSFDGVIVAAGAGHIFSNSPNASSTYYPTGRPAQILLDSYRYGKPVGFVGDSDVVIQSVNIPTGPGVYVQGTSKRAHKGATISNSTDTAETTNIAESFKDGLRKFRFLNRFPVEK